jgi:AbrB family looped-hinge helix DNA binding protein
MGLTTKTDIVHFGSKGQVVIPRRLRKDFEIENGTRAQVYAENGFIVLKPITANYIKSLRGSLKGTKAMEVFTAERRREKDL